MLIENLRPRWVLASGSFPFYPKKTKTINLMTSSDRLREGEISELGMMMDTGGTRGSWLDEAGVKVDDKWENRDRNEKKVCM